MNMNLFAKAVEFERLCRLSIKNAQKIDPTKPFRFDTEIPAASLSGPDHRFSVPWSPDNVSPSAQPTSLVDAANKLASTLVNFNPEQWQGVSLDVNAVKAAGNSLTAAVQSKKYGEMLKALQTVLNLSRDGGGALYGMAKNVYTMVQQAVAKAKANTPAKPAPWLNQYMAGQEAEDAASGMQASLKQPSAVQPTLDRSNKIETLLQ